MAVDPDAHETGPAISSGVRSGVDKARISDWRQFYERPRAPHEMIRWAATHAEMVTDLLAADRILEVGTGTGMLSGLLSRTAPLVVSIDYSAEVLATARQFFDLVRAPVREVRGDGFRLPFAAKTFDAAFSQGLLEHFAPCDVIRMVDEQLRVASRVYASVPSFFYPRLGSRGPGLIGNERLCTTGAWRKVLKAFDAEVEYYADFKVATVGGVTIPWPNQILIRIR